MFRNIRRVMQLDVLAASQDALKTEIGRLAERMEANYAELRRDYLDLKQDFEDSRRDDDREKRVNIAIAKMDREIKLQSEELRKTAAALMDRMAIVKGALARSGS